MLGLGSRLALAVQRGLDTLALLRDAGVERRLNQAYCSFCMESDRERLLDVLAQHSLQLLGATRVDLALPEAQGPRHLVHAFRDDHGVHVRRCAEPLRGRLAERFREAERRHLPWAAAAAQACVPLRFRGGFLGLLRVRLPVRCRRVHLETLRRLAVPAAGSLHYCNRLRELKALSSLHTSIVHAALEGIWLLDANDRTSFANARMAEMLGCEVKDLLGRPMTDFLPVDQQRALAERRQRHHAGRVVRADLQFCRRDGGDLWAMVSSRPLLSPRGEYEGCLAMITDITDRKRTELELWESQARLRLVSAQMPGAIWTTDRELRFTSLMGRRPDGMPLPEELIGRDPATLVGPDDPGLELGRRALRGESISAEGRWFGRNAQVHLEPLRGTGGEIVGTIGISTDVTELRRSQAALYEARERAQVTLEAIADGVVTTDPAGRIAYLNPAAAAACGIERDAALGRPLDEVFRLVDELSGEPVGGLVARALSEGSVQEIKHGSLLCRADGRTVPVEDSVAPIRNAEGEVTGVVLVFHDVSSSRALADQLSHQATHDALTGLPNRALLLDHLQLAVDIAARHGNHAAVLFLDLDRFKHINDTLGHGIGDGLLREVAQRLLASVRRTDTVSRRGGDEFVVLLAEVERLELIAELAAKLVMEVAAPYRIEDHELHVTTSIGISVFPEDGGDPETLIKQADIAMYHAKESGRNNFRFFTQDMNRKAGERLFLEHSLQRALAHGELSLLYQPQISLSSGQIVGAEALLRWHHPRRGHIPPRAFVPVAEDCGLITAIGNWVLEEACRQAVPWRSASGEPLRIAVNFSPVQFRRADAAACVQRVLEATGLAPQRLELELTEGMVMHNAEQAVEQLARLKALGVRLAIDDFGTGYSSLSYLKRFPVDSLKIDQAFVRDIRSDPNDAAIASAIISMGHSLRLEIVAEGVEDQEALAFLTANRCDDVQGNFFSQPLTAADFSQLLADSAR